MTETVGGAPLGALSHRNFRLFFFGQAVSLSGTWMQTVAQGWLCCHSTTSPFSAAFSWPAASLGFLLPPLYPGAVAAPVDKPPPAVLPQTRQFPEPFPLPGPR